MTVAQLIVLIGIVTALIFPRALLWAMAAAGFAVFTVVFAIAFAAVAAVTFCCGFAAGAIAEIRRIIWRKA